MEVNGHECLQRGQEVMVLSQDMLYFHVLFKRREIRTLRTKMAIVSLFPAMDGVALVKGLVGHLGLRSQERACRPEV